VNYRHLQIFADIARLPKDTPAHKVPRYHPRQLGARSTTHELQMEPCSGRLPLQVDRLDPEGQPRGHVRATLPLTLATCWRRQLLYVVTEVHKTLFRFRETRA